MKNIWDKISELNKTYHSLKLSNIIDYDKYKLYSIVTSSTQLEGSTLDETDTKLLLDDGLTAKGKPMMDHKMVEDNYKAISYGMKCADEKLLLTATFLCQLNALNMYQTGEKVNTTSGHTVDGSNGEFRKDSRFAQAIGTYPNFQKIPELVFQFCEGFNNQIKNNKTDKEHLITSFDAHVNLVLIHPWMDGNKRTSRLLMNFLQRRAGLPLTKVHKEDSKEYIDALKYVKDHEDLNPFREFMAGQHIKTLENEIREQKQDMKRNKGFSLIF